MSRQRRSEPGRRSGRPATTPEARELELASAAYDLAERQIEEGTASSQVITHFLKAGSTRERMEQQRMEHEIELMEEKRKQLEGQQRMESLFSNALEAFRGYSGAAELPPGEDGEP